MSNTTVRTVTSLIGAPLVLVCIFLGQWFLFSVVLLISIVATWEMLMMFKVKNIHPNFWVGIGLSIAFPLSFMVEWIDYRILVVGFIFGLTALELFRDRENPTSNVAVTVFTSGYIGIGIGSVLGIRELLPVEVFNMPLAWMTFSVFLGVWTCDTLAFFGGKWMGRTKLFPRISPNKTWEGAIWGFIGSVLAVGGLYYYTPMNTLPIEWHEALTMGVLIGSLGQFGDLIESMIKRDMNIKDSSHLLPGHGGMFDRFDALIFISPIIFLYLRYVLFPE